jgi:hypothetical protein
LIAGGYIGPYAVIENGCDAEFFLKHINVNQKNTQALKKPIVIFQGGINARLDYALLLEVTQCMSDWDFHFYGTLIDSEGWKQLKLQKNVKYLGNLLPDELAQKICAATVGIIPFIQDQWIKNSLPLKTYEYIACGLPVVSVPITALEKNTALISFASTAAEFVSSIRKVASLRFDESILELRRATALANSYDERFKLMSRGLLEAKHLLSKQRKKLRVAILYDTASCMVNTIREHLDAFNKYSNHSITYIPATRSYWAQPSEDFEKIVENFYFDVVIVHYSVRVSINDHFDAEIERTLCAFNGLKVLFIQDEYEGTEIARLHMDRVNYNIVYTCVPASEVNIVYPQTRFPSTDFLTTLTGYIPESESMESASKPLKERQIQIAYRGRKLPSIYGNLGNEKYRIGIEMKALTQSKGISVDIETDHDKRIYGNKWYEFIGSARATLGTESGSNIFDFDGSIAKKIEELEKENPDITYEEIHAQVLSVHEGLIKMNQISPKIFEAIRLRTALVLFEGEYSGVVKPNEHYISLNKDFSNVDEVFEKIKDDGFLTQLTERAYQDIINSGKYSYRRFIQNVDIDLEDRVLSSHIPGTLIRSTNIAAYYASAETKKLLASKAQQLENELLASKAQQLENELLASKTQQQKTDLTLRWQFSFFLRRVFSFGKRALFRIFK